MDPATERIWDALHASGRQVLPAQELPPKRYWVGVLLLGKSPEDNDLNEFHFLWMKAHSKITVDKIRQCAQEKHPGKDIEIRFRTELTPSTTVRDLNYHGDGCIIFQAVEKAPFPLESVDRQLNSVVPENTEPSTSTPGKPEGHQVAKSSSHQENTPAAPWTAQGRGSLAPTDSTLTSLSATPDIGQHAPLGADPIPRTDLAILKDHIRNRLESHGGPSTPAVIKPEQKAHSTTTTGSAVTPPSLTPSQPQLLENKWYGVPRGHKPGVYTDYEEVKRQVAGYPRGYQQKFATREEAQAFVDADPAYATAGESAPLAATPQSQGGPSMPATIKPENTDRRGPATTAPIGTTGTVKSEQYDTPRPGEHAPYGVNPPYHGGPPTPVTIKPEQQDRDPTPTPEPEVSFDPSNVFSNESQIETGPEAEAAPNVHIREILDSDNLELLEAGVAQGLRVIGTLQGEFSRHGSNNDAQLWSAALEKLKLQAEQKRTVVGVVGNTGAGKSSVINALLDEERLVPTNCMRACTAVVTEMSWNESEDPMCKYRAEIEFITRSDWEKELTTLFKEFLTENGTVSRDTADPNTDAGIAWAKFHAVYPKKTKESIAESDVTTLVNMAGVSNVLGSTKKINTRNPEPFYRELQKYVDSKEKATGKKKKNDNERAPPREMEYWPLIKVVKIRTRSPALSTGAVIVDLPGVHDSNAARAAVASGYMKQCTGLWIVAPINRAVDDKAAKTLLGDSFKRQLQYDGGFSQITFICSKTDDISITEATDSLDLEDEMAGLKDEKDSLETQIKDLKSSIEEIHESKNVFNQAYDEAVDDIEVWEDLKDQMNKGKEVYAPVKKAPVKAGKRKRATSSKKSRKRRQPDHDDSDDAFLDDNSSESETDADSNDSDPSDDDKADDDEVEAPQEPLTEEAIESKLEELRDTKKNARRRRNEFGPQVKEILAEIREIKKRLAEVRSTMTAICIEGRNSYSKGAIQLDFAAGIKELDMENAAEDENFDPDEDQRDYDQVANSLPVFCVSSRAYQKMCGRLQKDEDVPGFTTPEETEIPQLQAHCKKLTEAGRIESCRKFLLNLSQQLNTFSFWASDDGFGLKLSDDQKRSQIGFLTKRLTELEKGLEKAREACISNVKQNIENQIFDKYPDLIEEAVNAAPATSIGWGARKDQGGLHFMTYKAMVRRDGVYTSPTAGFRDFNAELIEPITKKLATHWERTFVNRLPKAYDVYIKGSNKILNDFHDRIEAFAQKYGVGLARVAMLKAQITTYERLFAGLKEELIHATTDLQREANRDFTPTIVGIMHTVYEICTEERGPGCLMRMRQQMTSYVDQQRHTMFKDATTSVQENLNRMCRELENKMEERADEIYIAMRNDYLNVLGGVKVNAQPLSKEDRTMRAEIRRLVMDVDGQFKRVLDGETENVELSDVMEVDKDDEVEPERVEIQSEAMNIDRDDEDDDAFEPMAADTTSGAMEDNAHNEDDQAEPDAMDIDSNRQDEHATAGKHEPSSSPLPVRTTTVPFTVPSVRRAAFSPSADGGSVQHSEGIEDDESSDDDEPGEDDDLSSHREPSDDDGVTEDEEPTSDEEV